MIQNIFHRHRQLPQDLWVQCPGCEQLIYRREYQDNLKIYKPAFPKMQQLRGQIAEIDNQIKEEIQDVRRSALATYRAAKTQEGLLRDRLNEAKQQMLDLQGRNIRYSILKREVDTNRQLYDGLLQRLKEIGVAGGSSHGGGSPLRARVEPQAGLPALAASPWLVILTFSLSCASEVDGSWWIPCSLI